MDSYYFYGNCTAKLYSKEGKEINESTKIRLINEDRKNISGFEVAVYYATIKDSKNVLYNIENDTFVSVYGEADTFMLFHIGSFLHLDINEHIKFLINTTKKHNISDFSDIRHIIKKMEEDIKLLPSYFNIFAFEAKFLNESNQTHTFAIQRSIYGELITENNANITFITSQFDMAGYVIEGKIFGVVVGLAGMICAFAWISLISNYKNDSQLQQLSCPSFVIHVGIDFSLSLLIIEIGMSSTYFFYEMLVVFAFLISLYFTLQVNFLAKIWKAQIIMAINDQDYTRRDLLFFFLKIIILMSLSSVTVTLSFEFPIITLPFIYSSFMPQIFRSTQILSRKNKDSVFVVLVTLYRLIPLWYFTFYPRNINGEVSYPIGIIFTIYSIFLALVVLLQNKFGGLFFLPKCIRPVPYDYFSHHVEFETECTICLTPIDEEDETMTTPCGHSFHRRCLERWMEERSICPMDRLPLPPIY